MFEGVRDRVRDIRNQQDELAVQKAEAAVAYAVSLTPTCEDQLDLT